MSEERFVVSTNLVGEIIVTDTETGNVYHYGSMSNFLGLIRLLNELNDENDILKQQLQTRYIVNKQYEELQRLKKENEQLNELNEENQELKRLIKKMGELGGFNKHLIKTICGELNDE